MQYINYPAKTLIKSSRVVFTMLFGVLMHSKVYSLTDYTIVLFMVIGLGSFLHADSQSSAVFEVRGVLMLTISLLCDGMICNVSETILKQYNVSPDEFIFRLYSVSLVCIAIAAAVNGDLYKGVVWSVHDGTYDEYLQMTNHNSDNTAANTTIHPTYSAWSKLSIMILFSSMGFFGSSCSAAITKNFGALTMSITSTARKATTLFLSFGLFTDNVCTFEHVFGMFVFMTALLAKSTNRKGGGGGRIHGQKSSSSSSLSKKMKKKNDGGGGTGWTMMKKAKSSSNSLMLPLVSASSSPPLETNKPSSLVHVV
jgi:solute carrier family 35 (adenosine 3'-phospho 5'-phosphosulfate transporter), member B3